MSFRQNRMKLWLSVATVGLFLPIAAGCGPAPGTLVGTVRVYGGPLTPAGVMALNGKPTSGSKVSARSGSTVLTATTDASGRFLLRLPPGRYTLTCAGPLDGGPSQPVEVRSDFRTSEDCRIDVP